MGRYSLHLGVRAWVYLAALLVPFAVYNLTLKADSITGRSNVPELPGILVLMRSDILFNLGYALLWVGVFAVLRGGAPRKAALVIFHALSVLIVLVTTCAYQYFHETGSTLDYSIIIYSLTALDEMKGVIGGGASPGVVAALVGAVVYLIVGPWVVSRFAVRLLSGRMSLESRTGRGGSAAVGIGSLSVCVVAALLVSLSLVPGAVDADRSFSRDPFVNVFVTGINAPSAEKLEGSPEQMPAVTERTLEDASLRETPATEKRNVVLVSLESTRARSVTPYNKDLKTTPYMDELSRNSLMAEWSYTIIPHTSKALTAVNCGINPHTDTDIHEAEPGGIPARCLAELFVEQGYNTAYFQSATEKFENRRQHMQNAGYEHFQALEQMDTEGFERANYFGYEDNIMLEPGRKWVEEYSDEPFFMMYNTITPHHEWLAPKRYGRKDFAEEDRLNRYQNSVRYLDFFLENLINEYKEAGEYEDTVFVIMGDHGEGFAEHGIRGHDNVIYEEGLRTPFFIHDPQRWHNGKRLDNRFINQLDVAPTIVDMLNYELENGEYLGTSLLEPVSKERPLYFNCRPDLLCAASIEDGEKYIHHYGKRSDEYYDLRKDPYEQNDIIDEQSDEEIARRQENLLTWRRQAAEVYDENGAGEPKD
jgi:arylsulfatase A-like enzyme